MALNPVFKKLERSSQTPPGWRLATVGEAQDNLGSMRSNLLEKWDRVRLLDGWIGGDGYGYYNVKVRFKPCLGYMLVVQAQTPARTSEADGRKAPLYSEVPELSNEGRGAAILLSCEDWNEEVLHWSATGLVGDRAMREVDRTKAASEAVSAIARMWQGVHANSRELTEDSLENLRIGFQECLKALEVDTEKSLRALLMNTPNSEQGNIIEEILKEVVRESDLRENFAMFQDFEREVAEIVWDVVVENIAWQTFYNLCSGLYRGKVVMDSAPSLADLICSAYDILGGKEPKGDLKFNEILQSSCEGKPDVLGTCLLRAVGRDDVELLKRLIERGPKLYVTDDDTGDTILHRAAAHEGNVEIAEMLLTGDKTLASAVNFDKCSPLHTAVTRNNILMCTLLIHHKASLTAKEKNGKTPLHLALNFNQYEEVVRVLLSGDGEDGVTESVRLVDVQSNDGRTPLDYALITHRDDESMVAWLLSLSSHPESYLEKLKENHPLSVYLRESSRMGYVDLVQKLLDGAADPFEGDDEGRTALHYAVEGEDGDVALNIIEKLLFDKKQGIINWGKASEADKYGRNVLHVAAFLGRNDICGKLILANRNLMDGKDRDGQTPIYYAVAGPHDDPSVLYHSISREQGTNKVLVKDFSQMSPLHVAAARGKLKVVEELLSMISKHERRSYVEAPDVLGQTALHKAASGGHWRIVEILLEEGAHPLRERDCDGKTALSFAAQADGEKSVKIAQLLLGSCESYKQRSLLLFASAVGTALPNSSPLEKYLKQEKEKIQENLGPENLLRVAATLGDTDMTLECLNKGANIALIHSKEWTDRLSEDEKRNVQDVRNQIKTIVEQGTDKPALEDNLGRSPFAIGLAALFLNPFVKSPVTVGISGEWGMGKSSVMLQTESNLLNAAAQLAFKSSYQNSNLAGAGESKLSITGQGKRRKIANAIDCLDAKKGKHIEETRKKQVIQQAEKCDEVATIWKFSKVLLLWKALRGLWNKSAPMDNLNKFNDFLENYQPKYHQIFKSLAVMDRSNMFDEDGGSGLENETVGQIPWEEDFLQGIAPSILTVRYNAWHYRNETEAWAGLAVEITKELEATMTVAHKLRTSWIYNWRNHRDNICLKVIFPFFLALLAAIILSSVIWLVLGTAHNEDINKVKYVGLPVSIIVAAWGVGKSVISFVKPISSQVVDYICLPDHSQKLGYHQKVIDDINFLKQSLYYKCSLKWEVFAFLWCCITWRWNENYVPETKIPKMPPASGNDLRMIVFVDDLDRCEENVILQVLSAVNLVLATCKINVIMSMEDSMIERAIIRKYGNNNRKDNKELAEKYVRKIVQLPLHLPDPNESESSDFLKRQLGMWDSIERQLGMWDNIEAHTDHGRRKGNPKFEILLLTRENFKQGRQGRKQYFAESVAKLQRTLGISGWLPEITEIEEVVTYQEHPIDEEDAGVEETMTDTTDNRQPIGTGKGLGINEGISNIAGIERDATIDIHQETIKNAERASRITQVFSYVRAVLHSICNARSHKEIEQPVKEDERGAGDQQQREDSTDKRSLMDDLFSIISSMLIPMYTPGERSAFRFLHTRCTRTRKLPREWKCFMAYHRLAWNILYLIFHQEDFNRVEGWQVQLIAWIFVCWEWRNLITVLIKNWNKLEVLRNWKGEEGPSLREIVEHYIYEKWPTENKSATKKEDDAIDMSSRNEEVEKTSDNMMTTISREEDMEVGEEALRKILNEQKEMIESLRKAQEDMMQVLRKVQEDMSEVLKEQEEMSEMLMKKVLKEEEDNKGESSRENQKIIIKKFFTDEEDAEGENSVLQYSEAEDREEWIKLRDTLRRYNVSMQGVQAFQKFRFYCQPGHLPWPLPKQD